MYESLKVEDLVRRAKIGQVTKDEIERIAEELPVAVDADLYRLVYILLRTGSREHEKEIARFLHYPRDPQVAALVLGSLCVQWELSGRYRKQILEALGGVEWDVLGELKQAAISSAGEHLRITSDSLMLERLIEVAETYEVETSGQFAVEALARALGEPHAAAAFPHKEGEGHDWAEQILARAKIRLAGERPADDY